MTLELRGVALAFAFAVAAGPVPGVHAARAWAAETRASAAAASARVPAGLGVPAVPVTSMDGVPVVGANDLARLIGASRTWRADVRKLGFKLGEHRITFTDGNPFVIVDDHMLRLEHAVRSRAGEMQIPVEFARLLPEGPGWPRLAYGAEAGELRVAPALGFIGSPRVVAHGGVTSLVIPAEHSEGAVVVGRSRARFRLRVAGALVGALPDSLPDDALLRDLAVSLTAGGVTFELAVDPTATGWRLERDASAGGVTLLLARGAGGFDEFAPEGAPGPRVLRTLVLDPGHGGADPGAQADGADEKSLALELARAVADELHRRSTVRVVLTRADDRDLPQEARAEAANRAQADAVLSLHFGATADGAGPAPGGGPVAWCAPAAPTSGGGAEYAGDGPENAAGVLGLLPWRYAALPRAVESRGLAESVTSALARNGFGPTSVRERLPFALLGVHAPGVLLECGSLTDPGEMSRLLSPGGLKKLAAAIADGVLAWQRGD